jgi:hypothetical protein
MARRSTGEENARDLKRVTGKRDTRSVTRISLPLKFPCTLCEKVIFAVDVYHAVLEYALPLVLNPSNLVIGAKDNIAYARTFLGVLLAFRVRVI